MQIFELSDIIEYDDVFSESDYSEILKYVERPMWRYGHGSYPKEDARYKNSYPFWIMELMEEKFFSEHLLNIIRKKTKLDLSLYYVYANGHTYGTKGVPHQDWAYPNGKTFLYYVNPEWDPTWGGKIAFYLDENKYYFHLPKPNNAVLFPGVMYHNAEETSRSFNGLRITIAWKLILE